jgi:4a-hydroxytetrahydrobiopterin dehydratase
MDLLTHDDVTAALAELPGWSGDPAALRRTCECPSFPAAIAAVNRIAEIAEEFDHHPDIDIRWRTLILSVSTHSADGVTAADVALAHRIEAVLAAA